MPVVNVFFLCDLVDAPATPVLLAVLSAMVVHALYQFVASGTALILLVVVVDLVATAFLVRVWVEIARTLRKPGRVGGLAVFVPPVPRPPAGSVLGREGQANSAFARSKSPLI